MAELRRSSARQRGARSASTATTTSPCRSTTAAVTRGSPARAPSGRAAGDLGVIPGSMGTRSYIVAGLGSPASYDSCSHGAGPAPRGARPAVSSPSPIPGARWPARPGWRTRPTSCSTRTRWPIRTSTRSWPTRPTSSGPCTPSPGPQLQGPLRRPAPGRCGGRARLEPNLAPFRRGSPPSAPPRDQLPGVPGEGGQPHRVPEVGFESVEIPRQYGQSGSSGGSWRLAISSSPRDRVNEVEEPNRPSSTRTRRK